MIVGQTLFKKKNTSSGLRLDRKSILISSNTYWSLYNFRRSLIKHLLANNYDVIAACPADEYKQQLIEMGCRVHDIAIVNAGLNPVNEIKVIVF